MIRDFSEEKKQELYDNINEMQMKQWISFSIWHRNTADNLGEWRNRVNYPAYMRPAETYEDRVLETYENFKQQIEVIFQSVEETDQVYSEKLQDYLETIKGQIKTVNQIIYELNPSAEIPSADGRYDTKEERVLRNHLRGRGVTDTYEQQKLIDWLETERPDLVNGLYITDCYSSADAQTIMRMIMDCYYQKDYYVGKKYKYPKAYIEGIIKAYETHKTENGRFVLDNGGRTIGYGHDVKEGEDFSAGLSEEEALELAISDLDEKYDAISRYINTLNKSYNQDIHIEDFKENEIIFLLDFAYNRGAGLVKRPDLENSGEPYSSLALLIIATSKNDEETIVRILREEVYSLDETYYEGLELRRMDEYEILEKGDYTRNEDIDRGIW